MKIEALLKISIALLAVLGTVLLSLATGSILFPALVLLSAMASLWLTDYLECFWINRMVANVLALTAAAFCLASLLFTRQDNLLVSIGNFLVLVQVILMFHKKTQRVFWELMILSLLLVVVAAALQVTPESGVWLVMYMVVGISAMMLLHAHVESKRFADSQTQEQRLDQDRRNLDGPPVAEFRAGDGITGPTVSRRLLTHAGLFAVTTFTMTAVLFCSVPRHGDLTWSSRGKHADFWSQTGFRAEINLGRTNRVYSSEAEVMRVTLTDEASGKPYPMDDGPYLRGAVLIGYTGHRWHPQTDWASRSPVQLRAPPATGNLVRVEVLLENPAQRLAFGVFPVWRASKPLDVVMYDEHFDQLVGSTRGLQPLDSNYRYAMTTTALRGGKQLPVTPFDEDGGQMPQQERRVHTRIEQTRGPDQFENLRGIATDLCSGGSGVTDPYQVALTLEKHFLQGGQYQYSLDLSNVPRDGGLDPLEDFVTNHRTGHCEYFASSLALMLRTQDIPSRVVVGFKGGEHNPVGRYYQFRELHTHAWVEAYIDAQHVPQDLLAASGITSRGVWLRLDPTPSSNSTAEGNLADYVQDLWDDYVVNYDSIRQREAVVDPLAGEEDAWLGMTPANWSKIPVQVWLPLLVVLSVGLLGFCVYRLLTAQGRTRTLRLLHKIGAKLKQWIASKTTLASASNDNQKQTRISVEFYERLTALLDRRGLRRVSNQTHREFAQAAQVCIDGILPEAHVNNVPLRIVEFFYRVRFGHDVLDHDEIESINRGLTKLETALSD